MCGIVGLLLTKPALHAQLGAMMLPMLVAMTERGPDSAGLAVFSPSLPQDLRKISLYAGTSDAGEAFDWSALASEISAALHAPVEIQAQGKHAIATTRLAMDAIKRWLQQHYPLLHVLSAGRSIALYKDTGAPAAVAEHYGFSGLNGSHLVGHTRMATESAVTPDRAHPFTAGEDFCLVHNGSLSNPNGVRRKIETHGIVFDTDTDTDTDTDNDNDNDNDNDTEAACRFLEWRLREGDTLETALQKGFEELDGFYTFLMGTPDALALIRDPFACKPALVAQTDDYVAIASEFQALAHLPDIKNASIFEPAPEEMYVWKI